jgi:hypothetical protein
MNNGSFLILWGIAVSCFVHSLAIGGVTKTVVSGKIIWSDDFLRPGGAEFLDSQQQFEYCILGTVPRPEYTASDPLLAGGYNSTSITIGNGVMGINHDEFESAFGPIQIAFAGLGWQNTQGICVGGSALGENDTPFDDNDICIYGGIRYNAWHLRFHPDTGPWGADAKPGFGGVDDDGDGTTDYGNDYTAVGGNDGSFPRNNTPDEMSVSGTYDGTIGCGTKYPSVEEYDVRVTVAGPYPNNGMDDDSNGVTDDEIPWEADVRRVCDDTIVLVSQPFQSGVAKAVDRGLFISFTDVGGTELTTGSNGQWDIDIVPTPFTMSANPPSLQELYGRNLKFHSNNPGYITPHGLDGKAGVAGLDDDGNGVTDEFETIGRPDTDDDSDGVTDEIGEVVLDELGERNAGDDADDTMGRGTQRFGLRSNIGTGSGIFINIDPGSSGGNLFSIREFVLFQESQVEGSDEIGPGFYQAGLSYGMIWCVSGTCYGAQLWVGNDGGNPVEIIGPIANSNHTGDEIGIGATQFGSGLVSLMERWPLVTNALYDDKFWAIEGSGNRPTVTVLQDRDRDGDVDGVDFSVFASCFNKAGNPPRTVGCTTDDAAGMDADNDGDVDGVDFSVFASCYNQAGNLPRAPGCYPDVISLTGCGT